MEFGLWFKLKTCWCLFVLAISAIPCAWVTLCCLIFSLYEPKKAKSGRTILVSGGKMTKALEICRSFKELGHRVILIESEDYWFAAPRFSTSVDKFILVPEHKNTGVQTYIDKLSQIIEDENVDVYVPVAHTVDVMADSMLKEQLEGKCFVWCENVDTTRMLDHKFSFLQKAKDVGLLVPAHFIVNTREEALEIIKGLNNPGNFFIKSIASDPLNRTKLRPIPSSRSEQVEYMKSYNVHPKNQHLIMQFLNGKEYCTTSIVKDGELLVHTTSPSGPVQLNYEDENIKEIEDWVRSFCKSTRLTGSHSFDFKYHNGNAYPIECNPRLHSAVVNFYSNRDALVQGYLSAVAKQKDSKVTPCQYPHGSAKETFWLYNELMHFFIAAAEGRFHDCKKHIRIICTGREALFSAKDPIPFFMMHHVQLPVLLWKALVHKKVYTEIDFNVGKLHWAH
uniref:ATP-grasp domain-containing protein n=1 Tax=Fibrocapsa japonica TaxID=94617 RepID=A0A7S2UWU6_9STRA